MLSLARDFITFQHASAWGLIDFVEPGSIDSQGLSLTQQNAPNLIPKQYLPTTIATRKWVSLSSPPLFINYYRSNIEPRRNDTTSTIATVFCKQPIYLLLATRHLYCPFVIYLIVLKYWHLKWMLLKVSNIFEQWKLIINFSTYFLINAAYFFRFWKALNSWWAPLVLRYSRTPRPATPCTLIPNSWQW
jgi:hypothetical protein